MVTATLTKLFSKLVI